MFSSIKEKIFIKIKNVLKNVNAVNKYAKIQKSALIKGSTISSDCIILENSVIKYANLNGKIVIGASNKIEDSNINATFSSGENCRIYGSTIHGNVTIGKYSSLWGPNLDITTGEQKVSIGNFCSIARNVTFQTFNHNHKKISTYFIGKNLFNEKWENEKISKGDIYIENDVWIGAHSVILGGITIHNGAVVAANSVVTKDVPPYSIVGGIPARIIGYRFEEIMIQKIQELNWWDWSVEKINNNKALFADEITEKYLEQISNE